MQWRAYLLLTVTTLFWGGNLTVGKLAIGHVSPMVMNSLRWGIAALVISAFAMPQIRREWPAIKKNWPILFGFGAVGFASFNAFLYSGLRFTSAINGAIDQAAIPLLIFALNFVFFRVRASLAQLAGFALTLAGVAVTVSHGQISRLLSLEINFGDFLVLMAVLCYSFYTVCLRYKPALDWRAMAMACFIGAFIASLPMVATEAALGLSMLPHDLTGFGVIVFIGLFPSLVSQILFIRGVEMIGPNRAGLFINLIPVFGMILAVVVLGESPEGYHAIAFLLAIGGIALAEWGKPKQA
ncbi:DMT family transporter [Martelella mediterranea]|uniref:DMT family transporter n=1 Tax=uncultured Martelella sp. TaxID=392331 RepID=UPI000D074698